jgi:hypothetical protein
MVDKKYIILALVGIAVIGAGIYFFPTETKRVKKQFRSLAKWFSKEENEQKLVGAARIKSLSTLFADRCQFEIPSRKVTDSFTRDEIMTHAALARSKFETVSVKFYDIAVEFLYEGIAQVTTTATLKGTSSDGDTIDETHELDCTLQKIQDTWLFTEVKMVEVLKK